MATHTIADAAGPSETSATRPSPPRRLSMPLQSCAGCPAPTLKSLPQHIDRRIGPRGRSAAPPTTRRNLGAGRLSRACSRVRAPCAARTSSCSRVQALRNTLLRQRRTAARRPRAGVATLEDVEPMDPARASAAEEERCGAGSGFSANLRARRGRTGLALVAVDVAGLLHREARQGHGETRKRGDDRDPRLPGREAAREEPRRRPARPTPGAGTGLDTDAVYTDGGPRAPAGARAHRQGPSPRRHRPELGGRSALRSVGSSWDPVASLLVRLR